MWETLIEYHLMSNHQAKSIKYSNLPYKQTDRHQYRNPIVAKTGCRLYFFDNSGNISIQADQN